jgi:crossover junction endodeoxyribonuclease RuvC
MEGLSYNIPNTVLGLDISTNTGFAAIAGNGVTLACGSIDWGGIKRFERWGNVQFWFHNWLSKFQAPKLVVVEGYGYGNAFTLGTLVELGTLFRLELIAAKVPFLEVPPKSLKKFVTGTGVSAKQIMMKKALQLWNLDIDDDDAVDAYCLAQFGRAVLGIDVGVRNASEIVKNYVDKVISLP